MLRVENLQVFYGKLPAVRGVSLEVGPGELVGMIGPNGAGKTSTLAGVAGAVKVRQGHVQFEDTEITGWSRDRVARAGIALVPEGRHVFESMTVQENLALGLYSQPKESRAEVLEELLDRFPVLRTRSGQGAGKLSGGEQQQLAIARALAMRPRVLLLDEPSLGLAPQLVDLIFQIVDELRQSGLAILLVEQNAIRTLEAADRTYVIQHGQVVQSVSKDDLSRPADAADTLTKAVQA